jgi:hypothetical protein
VGGELSLVTCTVASNRAVSGWGGGIYDTGSDGIYRSTTIAGNQAAVAGGIYASGSDFGNTLIAGNTAAQAADAKGDLFSSDYNLLQNLSGWILYGESNHTVYGNPLLGPLANNGGPTPTMALLVGSPAIDRGKNFGIVTDQRGRQRPFDHPGLVNAVGGDGTDIGAFELISPTLQIARSGTNAVLSWATNDPSFQLQSAQTLNGGVVWSNVPGTRGVLGNQFIVVDPVAATKKFYRLSGP